jgi:hypothetical protein
MIDPYLEKFFSLEASCGHRRGGICARPWRRRWRRQGEVADLEEAAARTAVNIQALQGGAPCRAMC